MLYPVLNLPFYLFYVSIFDVAINQGHHCSKVKISIDDTLYLKCLTKNSYNLFYLGQMHLIVIVGLQGVVGAVVQCKIFLTSNTVGRML